MRRGRSLGLVAALFALPTTAGARSRFEPTDLELEGPGVVELDTQIGTMRGDPRRVLVLDWELDVGLAPNVEVGVDGAVSWVGPAGGPTSRRWDPLWISAKLGLVDARDPAAGTAWALGVQLGPRVPVQGARGLGYEALLLLGRTIRRLTVVANVGLFVDGPTIDAPRAVAAQVGVDATFAIGEGWSVLGEIAGQRFFTADPHQAGATVGLARAFPWGDLSVIGIVGFVAAGDRWGLLLGASPKFTAF